MMPSMDRGQTAATPRPEPELQRRVNDIVAGIGRVAEIHLRIRNAADRLVPRQPRAVPPTANQKDGRISETMDSQLARIASALQTTADEMVETAEDLDRAV